MILVRSPSFAIAASLSAGPEIVANGDGAGGIQTLTAGLVIGR